MNRFFYLLLFSCCLVTAVSAQITEQQTSMLSASDSVTIARLSDEVGQLRLRAERWDKVMARLPKVSGYMQAGYEGATGSSSFLVKSVRVWAVGSFASKLDYTLHMELVSPRLLDAFIRYRPFDALNIQVGEFKIPFTIENTEYTPLKAEFVECPLAVIRLVALKDICGIASSGRDLGAMLSGGFFKRGERHILNYNLGVFNGEGVNTWDKNTSKDIVGRIMLRPVRGLTLAGYYYWGETGSEYFKRTRYGGGMSYDRGLGVLRGEYIAGTTGMKERGDLKSEGWYALGGIRPVKSLMIAARYDTFTENRSESATRQTNYTAGLTWEPVKYLRCQLDYTYENYAATDVRNRNVVVLMFTGIF